MHILSRQQTSPMSLADNDMQIMKRIKKSMAMEKAGFDRKGTNGQKQNSASWLLHGH